MDESKLPNVAPLPRRRRGGPRLDTLSLALETTTPLLGGGVVPREVDRCTPIRPASVRGSLRFWWRALTVHDRDARALAEREAALWGAMGRGDEKPRRSAVEVRVDTELSEEELDEWIDTDEVTFRHPDVYALWPARSDQQGRGPAERWKPGLRFRLHLRAPEDDLPEVERAVRAWLLFGGLGSRTRRGVGSLTLAADAEPELRRRWLPEAITAAELERLLGPVSLFGPAGVGAARQTPALHGADLIYGRPEKDAVTAWHQALGWLRDFRQGSPRKKGGAAPEHHAREAPPPNATGKRAKRPGRSNWPEADKVRLLNGPKKSWAHSIRYADPAPAWPRAGFGLPIVGQFQREDRNGDRYPHPGEPPDFEIRWRDKNGEIRTRLASPLIVKAVPLSEKGFVPVALWLHRAYPDGGEVVLVQGTRKDRAVPKSAAPFDLLRGPKDPVHFEPLRAAKSLRDAFRTWLDSQPNTTRLTP